MIRINNEKSLDSFNHNEEVKAFLLNEIQTLLREYEVDSIHEFGEIQYLENELDVMNYENCGLADHLNEHGFEWIEKEELENGSMVYIISVVLYTDYGINIIVDDSLLDMDTKIIINNYFEKVN